MKFRLGWKRRGRADQVADPSPMELNEQLSRWSHSPYGQLLCSGQARSLAEVLSETAGYRAMLGKVAETGISLDEGSQLHKFSLAGYEGESISATTDFDALPLPSSVLDVAVLHHVLDFCEYPHEALKEAARVVLPSGHLVIVGFNPWSLFGLFRLVARMFSSSRVWRCRCLSLARMTDWLKLVGFQPEKILYGAYNAPLQSRRLLRRLTWFERLCARIHLPLGGYYVIVARKMRLRPISGRKEWLASAINPVKLASKSAAEPVKNGSTSVNRPTNAETC